MQGTAPSSPVDQAHHHRLRPAMRWRFRITGVVMFASSAFILWLNLFVFNSLAVMPPFAFLLFFISLIIGIQGGVLWYNAQYMVFSISSTAFSIHAAGYMLSSPWSNVRRISDRWGEGVLYLDKPAHVEGKLARLMYINQQSRYIQLNWWGQWRKATPLAHDLEAAIPAIVEAARSR